MSALGKTIYRPHLITPLRNYTNVPIISCLDQFHKVVLPNGITLINWKSSDLSSSVGVFIKAGSRFCVGYPDGIVHMAEKMALNVEPSSLLDSNSLEIFQKPSNKGKTIKGIKDVVDSYVTRDFISYSLNFRGPYLRLAFQSLSKLLKNGQATTTMISEYKREYIELSSSYSTSKYSSLFVDAIFQSAYRDNTLGIPLDGSQGSIDKITQNLLFAHRFQFYTNSRTTIWAINAHRDLFTELAKYYLELDNVIIPPVPNWLPPIDESVSQYTGGIIIKRSDSLFTHGPEESGKILLGLGFMSLPVSSPDIIPTYLLSLIINDCTIYDEDSWLDSLQLNRCYSDLYSDEDTGFFYIYGLCNSSEAYELLNKILKIYYRLSDSSISENLLEKVKSEFMSRYLTSFHLPWGMSKDLGLLIHTLQFGTEETIKEIERVTPSDIQRVCNIILNSVPSVAVLGSPRDFPSYERIRKTLFNKSTLSASP